MTICKYCRWKRRFVVPSECGAKPVGINYVTGGMEYQFCLHVNKDGHCPDYHPTWRGRLFLFYSREM